MGDDGRSYEAADYGGGAAQDGGGWQHVQSRSYGQQRRGAYTQPARQPPPPTHYQDRPPYQSRQPTQGRRDDQYE